MQYQKTKNLTKKVISLCKLTQKQKKIRTPNQPQKQPKRVKKAQNDFDHFDDIYRL